MELKKFKEIIKECVRDVLKEEFSLLIKEAVKGSLEVINENNSVSDFLPESTPTRTNNKVVPMNRKKTSQLKEQRKSIVKDSYKKNLLNAVGSELQNSFIDPLAELTKPPEPGELERLNEDSNSPEIDDTNFMNDPVLAKSLAILNRMKEME